MSAIPDDIMRAAWDAAGHVYSPDDSSSAHSYVRDIVAKAILAERERCAKVAEEKGQHWESPKGYEREACHQAAEAIRKGGTA